MEFVITGYQHHFLLFVQGDGATLRLPVLRLHLLWEERRRRNRRFVLGQRGGSRLHWERPPHPLQTRWTLTNKEQNTKYKQLHFGLFVQLNTKVFYLFLHFLSSTQSCWLIKYLYFNFEVFPLYILFFSYFTTCQRQIHVKISYNKKCISNSDPLISVYIYIYIIFWVFLHKNKL